MHPSTTQTTFEIAGQLISKGIDTRQMYTSLSAKPLNQVKMNGYVQSKQKQINNLSYFIMPKRTYKKFGVPFEQSSGLVFTLMFSSDTKYGFYAI
ncbi:MAG: hypothetical protein DRP42_05290 [Tenericutes bacterium]|nr:MAG: hypothetical protein DRP42_05290 [Mycoplasmatota bacterium]